MGHISGPDSQVSIAILVRLLLTRTMEIWDRECGPFRPIFTVFAILGQVENTMSPWGKGPSQEEKAILVGYHQASSSLDFRICSSGLSGVMQLTVRATMPNFALLALLCPVTRPSPRGTVSSQRDSKPNPDAGDHRGYQSPWFKTQLDEIATKVNPGRPREMANFANFGILTPYGDPVGPGYQGFRGNQVA